MAVGGGDFGCSGSRIGGGAGGGSFKTAMALLKPCDYGFVGDAADYLGGDGVVLVRFRQSERAVYHHVLVAPLTFASAAVGMASVNKQHEELFDAYKLGRLKKNPLSVYPASDGLCDFQHRRGGGDGG